MKRYLAGITIVLLGSWLLSVGSSLADPPGTKPGANVSRGKRPHADARKSPPGSRSGNGLIELRDCQIKIFDEVEIAAERAGVLDMVAAEGQQIEKGDMLAHTRDDLVKAKLAVATRQAMNDIEIRYAKKASELAQVEYERDLQANSIVSGAVSDLTLRAHRLAAEKALLQLEQAETSLEIEKLRRKETVELLEMYKVIAPMNGQVRTVFKKEGESVAEGEPILELVNPNRVKVEGYVPLQHLENVQIGSLVRVQLDVPDVDLPSERMMFPGRIASVDVKVEPVTHRVKVWAEVRNENAILKDGLTARMVIDPNKIDEEFAASRNSSAE